MNDHLQADADDAAAPANQNVVITEGNATDSVQAPTTTGGIWFAFEIGGGSASLNVNFNGQNYPNVSPGQYTLAGLTTPLSLDVKVDGSVKLAWATV